MKRILLGILFVVALFHAQSFSYSDFAQDYNHPELKWYTIETQHFKVHYFEGLRYKAEEVAQIAENLCKVYRNRYGITIPGKTDIVVQDSDIPGGWAAPVLNTITIDIHEFDVRLRGTNSWLRNVVTHELAHIISIRAALKFPPWIPDIRLGYFDYPNEKFQSHMFLAMSGDILPQWFAEGIAQYESQTVGSDSWDTHRDMIMRVSTLENKLLSYDEMCVFSGISLNFEKSYNHGFSMVNYIADKYGYPMVVSMLRESALIHRHSFKSVIKRVLGISADQLYSDWRNSLKETYTRQINSIGSQVYGEKLSKKGFNTAQPRWASDGERLYYLSNGGLDYGYKSLYQYNFSDTVKDDKKRIKMVKPGISSSYSITSDDKRVMHISAKKRDAERNPRFDVYLRKIKPDRKWLLLKDDDEKQLTESMSILYADLSKDAKSFAFVKKQQAADFLGVTDIKTGKPRYLFPKRTLSGIDTMGECNIYTPRLSPDGSHIVFSYFDGRNRQIGMIDTAGTAYYTFFKSGFDDRDPSWSPDGEWVLFSSDRTGIYNLYKKNVKTGLTVRLTNVAGGAFFPEMSPDGKKIAYVNYDKDGFGLYCLKDTTLESFSDKPVSIEEATDTLAPVVLTDAPKPYNSLPKKALFSPIIVGQEILAADSTALDGVSRWMAGGLFNLFDPVDKNFFGGLMLMQVDNSLDFFDSEFILNPEKDREMSFLYQNRMLPVTLTGEFNRRDFHDYDFFTNTYVANSDADTVSERLDYQISMMNLATYNRYQLTPSQKLHFIADYYHYSTFFYSIAQSEASFPRYPYAVGWRVGAMWTYLQQTYNSASSIAPQGMYLKLKLDRWQNSLIKEGSISEAFTITESGLIRSNLELYPVNMAKVGFKYGMGNPFVKKHVIGLSADITVLDRETHSFFEVGPFLKGYPFLKNRDSLYVSGSKALQAELDYYFPITKDINKSYSFLYIDQVYGKAFLEAGGAWNQRLSGLPDVLSETLLKSIGAELRMDCISYNVYPFASYFRTTYGMDYPEPADRMRYEFGILFSFDNWDLIDIPDYISRNVRSRLRH